MQTDLLTRELLSDFHNGKMTDAHQYFGAHIVEGDTIFTLWVPEVQNVKLVCTNPEVGQEEVYEMAASRLDPSIWQAKVPKNMAGYSYIYEITIASGERIRKSDPYARQGEMRPRTWSVVTERNEYDWAPGIIERKKEFSAQHYEKPLAIYELHIGTWKRNTEGGFLTYRELAEELIPYVKELGFTHIEILPITEHPLDESWGYQATGYFAPTIRYGTAEDLKYLVEQCAEAGIGLILDWIPGHFCQDFHGLISFNGQPLYEESREERRWNAEWGTLNFDILKGEVVSFLLSSAHYWLEEFKFDGFRMDALITQLFIPNAESRPQNQEGADFLRKLTSSLRERFPEAILIAEDAWGYPKVTEKAEDGGIGFHYKWNFGWMHDTLAYMKTPPEARPEAHEKMNFSLMYQYDEHYVLAFSHDEVVHGEGSLLNKLPGTIEEKFHQLRLLLGFWITHPGKKLLFMGQEFGHFDEWEFKPELDWASLDSEPHQRMALFTRELLQFYKSEKALFQLDDQRNGFVWLDADNHEQSTASFIRRGMEAEDECIILCNFSHQSYPEFELGVPCAGSYRQVFSTADEVYGGPVPRRETVAETRGVPMDDQPCSIKISLPAFTMCVWKQKREGSEAD